MFVTESACHVSVETFNLLREQFAVCNEITGATTTAAA